MTDRTITRFAPSPTGYLHIGGARTALFNWAMVRKHGGQFLLRFEDTDQKRSSKDAEQSILDDLRWLGLDWDNEDQEPRQSQRLELYDLAIEKLLAADRAYEKDGAIMFRMPDGPVSFDDLVRGSNTTPAGQIDDFVIRKTDGYPTFHLAVVVDDAAMNVTHVIRGTDHLTNTAKHVALQQALDLPTPSYCHISLTNNPDGSKLGKRDKAKAARKAALAHMESLDDPEAWIATLHEEDRKLVEAHCPGDAVTPPATIKGFLEKDNDELVVAAMLSCVLGLELPEIDVRDFRASGYLPQVIVNYLALLGWNPGGDVEQFGDNPLTFLRDHFDVSRLVKGAATFDRDKLAAFNGDAIRALTADQWQAMVWQHNQSTLAPVFDGESDPRFIAFANAYQQRSKTLLDPVTHGAFFFLPDDAIAYDFGTKAIKKAFKGEPGGRGALELLAPTFESLPDAGFGQSAHDLISRVAQERELNMGKLAQPLRVAVSGGTVTPPIDLTLEILGKGSTLARINHCLAAMPA